METMENNLPSATHQEKAKKMKKLRRWQIAISLFGVAIIVWGVIEVICLFLNYSQTETSNDAQIEQYVSPINLRASGYIDKIYFTEHQEVHKGDTLLVLDDREYKIRVMEAEAALKEVRTRAGVGELPIPTDQQGFEDALVQERKWEFAGEFTQYHADNSICLRCVYCRD